MPKGAKNSTWIRHLETHRPYPQEKSVPDLVADQALATPDAVAVAAGDRILTYKELDVQANSLAHHMRSLGVGPDSVVGLCLHRSTASVVGALGILKAGGAYLPLDPSHPVTRLEFLLDDAQARVVVTSASLREKLAEGRRHLVTLDEIPSYALPPEFPVLDAKSDDLAYVIYTSGSTGQPKGVEITHDSLLNLVHWHRRTFGVTAADRASHLSPVGFDAAVWELWPYLTAGASLHISNEGILTEPEALRDWLVAQGITIGFVPTPVAERLMALQWPADTALRTMLTGADTLHYYPPINLPFQLINNYGPTECTVVTTSGPVLPNARPYRLPPIGRPIANVQVYLLDGSLQPVPVGTVGEIYIGGAGVARGYRNRPDLTEERFLPNPFGTEPNTRLYKTGDLGCYLADGQIVFLGRIDDQIKIRGFRIEPNEVVTLLDEHPAVLQSAVVAREVGLGDQRLVAYLVLDPKSRPVASALRTFLAARLPEYMVPAMFVVLPALPLNPNGKLDRAALPSPSAANTLRDDNFAAPRTEVEEWLATTLAPLLGLDQVSVEDNFFLLGGHSLLGTQLIARVRDTFGVSLSLRSLFESPTLVELSREIERLILAKLDAGSEALSILSEAPQSDANPP
ncbi:MAG TPA: non-ribosomal peptide synthetase [Acidobacteriota bacterium]|jgi:amino acid adenylation domain-containing protein